jgi:hypothetical protein
MHDSWRDAAQTITATFVLGVTVGALTGLLATGPTYIDRLEGVARDTSQAVAHWLAGGQSDIEARQFADSSRPR